MPHRRSISGGAPSSAPCAVITRESRIAGDNTPMWGDAEARPTASPAHPIMSRSWKPTLWRPSRLWKGSTNAADKEACTTASLARHHAPKSGDNAADVEAHTTASPARHRAPRSRKPASMLPCTVGRGAPPNSRDRCGNPRFDARDIGSGHGGLEAAALAARVTEDGVGRVGERGMRTACQKKRGVPRATATATEGGDGSRGWRGGRALVVVALLGAAQDDFHGPLEIAPHARDLFIPHQTHLNFFIRQISLP